MTDYIYKEYPKWVTVGDAEPVLVQDAKEESVLLDAVLLGAPEPKRRGRPPKAVEAVE